MTRCVRCGYDEPSHAPDAGAAGASPFLDGGPCPSFEAAMDAASRMTNAQFEKMVQETARDIRERASEILQRVKPAAPLPWDWMWIPGTAEGRGHIYLLDADKRKIAAIWGKAEEKPATADLIISAVNSKADAEWALAIFLHAWEHDSRPPARAIEIAREIAAELAPKKEKA